MRKTHSLPLRRRGAVTAGEDGEGDTLKLVSWRAVPVVVLTAAALVVAGCGGGSYGGTAAAKPVAAKPAAAKAATASVGVSDSNLGNILVDAQGRTLYLFKADKGSASACSAACANIWPPLTSSGAPIGGTGVASAKLGTAKRSDGTAQITYNGHPLYTYAGDSGPGQATGEGSDDFGAEWYVVSPAGDEVQDAS